MGKKGLLARPGGTPVVVGGAVRRSDHMEDTYWEVSS